jgi:hypothetical protein
MAALSTVLRTTLLSYKNKRNSGIRQTETCRTSATSLDVPKLVGTSWLVVAPHMGQICALVCFLPYFTLPYLFFQYALTHQVDLHAPWLKRRGLGQAPKAMPFEGVVHTKLHLGLKISRKPLIFTPECLNFQPNQCTGKLLHDKRWMKNSNGSPIRMRVKESSGWYANRYRWLDLHNKCSWIVNSSSKTLKATWQGLLAWNFDICSFWWLINHT